MSRFLASIVMLAIASAVPAASFAQQPPLKVGIVFSFSGGDNVEQGKEFDAAVAAYVKEHGDTVAGRKIEFVKRDDGGIAPEVARRLTQELIVQDKIDLLVGTSYTPNALAMSQVSTQAKVPFFIVNASTSGILAKAPYTARFGFTQGQITDAFGRWAAKQGQTAFLLYQDYGPGIDAGTTFSKAFTAAGGTVLGEARIPVENRDFTAYVQRAKDAKPKILYAFVNATGGGIEFLKAIKDSGIEKAGTKVLVNGALVNEAILPAEGDSALGVYSTSDYTSTHDSALNRQFVRDFKAAYGGDQSPSFIAVAAYDAMNAAYKVIEAQHGTIDPDKTMAIVEGMKFESPRGPIAIDPATRDIILNAYFMRAERRNGTLGNYEFETTPMVKDPNE